MSTPSGSIPGPPFAADPDFLAREVNVIETSAPLRLHELRFLQDGPDFVVGRVDIDSYGVFPPDGAALLRQLVDGVPPTGAADWYQQTYGEPVDMAEFLGVLTELDFVAG